MKLKLNPIATSLCLALGTLFAPAASLLADTSSKDPSSVTTADSLSAEKKITADMEKISSETHALQEQMAALQAQLKELKQAQHQLVANQVDNYGTSKQSLASTQTNAMLTSNKNIAKPLSNTVQAQPLSSTQSSSVVKLATATSIQPVSPDVYGPISVQQLTTEQQDYYNQLALKALRQSGYMGGSPVVTSPYLGVRTQYNGSNLIINMSAINSDVALLQQEQNLEDAAIALGIPSPKNPRVAVSGEIQPVISTLKPYSGSNTSSITLGDAELDMVALVDPWVRGYMSFVYNGNPMPPISNASSSTLSLDRGFVTLGDLNKLPVYASIGQLYVPFGQYSSYMISDPVTELLGEIKAISGVLGYQAKAKTGLNASIFTFENQTQHGGTTTTGSSSIGAWGANLDWVQANNTINSDIGLSFVSNIANSIGLQSTGATQAFAGFGSTTQLPGTLSPEALEHSVPGLDVRGHIGYDAFTMYGEFVGATRHFAPQNMSFNGEGAQPAALYGEGVYQLNMFNKPTSIAVGYGHTWQALAANLPENRYLAAINWAAFQNTIASIEARHSVNYSSTSTANGGNLPNSAAFNPPGHTENALTGEITLFF